MSLEELFPFMAQDGGTFAIDLESKFAVFAKSSTVCIMCRLYNSQARRGEEREPVMTWFPGS